MKLNLGEPCSIDGFDMRRSIVASATSAACKTSMRIRSFNTAYKQCIIAALVGDNHLMKLNLGNEIHLFSILDHDALALLEDRAWSRVRTGMRNMSLRRTVFMHTLGNVDTL